MSTWLITLQMNRLKGKSCGSSLTPTYVYGEQYEVSNTGEVRNRITKNILIPQKDNKGYLRVRMSLHDRKVSAKIHRLVAIAFIPNPENKPQVNHINCNKEGNRVENLEWVTTGKIRFMHIKTD